MSNKLEGLTDAQLVVLAKEGDASAFEEIYDRHFCGVARALASFAGPDRDLLDDLAQDVFVRVIEGLSSYVPRHPFSHWLYTIALNVGRNHVRRSSKVMPVDPSELEEITPAVEERSDVSEQFLGRTLMRLVSRLPVPMREVVSLRIGSSLPYGEIAEILGIPEGTARSRMFNAVATLRGQLTANHSKRSYER